MELKEAIKILAEHNKWRRNDNVPNDLKMQEPKQIGKAIDLAVSELNKLLIHNVSHRIWDKENIINQLWQFETVDEAKRWFEEYGG